MGIQKSRKNEEFVEALEEKFDKALVKTVALAMGEERNLSGILDVEGMTKFKEIYDIYNGLIYEMKTWARRQDEADHIMNCNIYQMQKSLERIERKLERK